MSRALIQALLVVVLGGVGVFLLLPHRHGSRKPQRIHALGAILGLLAIIVIATTWAVPEPWLNGVFFYTFGVSAIVGAVLSVTARDPIHNALWFAFVVLSTSGLFLLAGAQFLAASTIIVYAGAIIVTFLFVIMLAQMEGRSAYDRAAKSPWKAALSSSLIFLAILLSLHSMDAPTDHGSLIRLESIAAESPPRQRDTVREIVTLSSPPSSRLTTADGHLKPHVAGLGEALYSDHLITVEFAGALLFVALIGALVIASPKKSSTPSRNTGSLT